MAILRVQGFSGVIPVRGDRAIPDNFAVESVNTWLYGEELRGVRPPIDVIAINPGTREVLRIPKRTVGGDPDHPTTVPPPSYLGDSVWVQFDDPDTDIVKGQLIEDQYERWYFCSPSTGPMFNTYARLVAGQTPYKLGVQGPNTDIDTALTPPNAWSPIITGVTGGAAPVETRAYVYTWVNEFGEESTPSLPGSWSGGNSNGIWHVTNILDPPSMGAGYPAYAKKILYRTVTGESGQTTYYRVEEVPIGTTVYDDDGSKLTNAIIVGNLVLESTSWSMPPDDLEGWIAMPNGFLIGFRGNDIYFSEAYHWHAWPAEYKQATETPVVGLGVLGTTCVVCTEGYPTAITGTTPAACSFTKATTGEPCLSRGSIVSTPDGVVYASQNGLILVGPSGINNITKQLITKDDWTRVYHPQHIRAIRYQNGYLALRNHPPAVNSGFFLDPTDLKVALTELTDFEEVVALNVDTWSGEVFLLEAGLVRQWDPPTDELMPVKWLSKEFQYPYKANFGCYAIYWDDARYSDADYGLSVMPVDQKVRFRAYANRQIVYDQVVPRNGEGVRLPSGFKSDIWQFEIRARAPVYSLHVASTMKELKGA